MTDQPILPYGAEDDRTSGFTAGVSTSEERARRADADGITSKRQADVLAMLNRLGPIGATWHRVAERFDLHHGQASGVLSGLHKAGKIARLTERRNRSFVYVLPEYVNGRDTQQQGRAKQPNDELAVALIQAEATILRVEDALQEARDKGLLTIPISAISAAIAGWR